MYFRVSEKLGVKLISRGFADPFCNFFVIEEVFFRNDPDVGVFCAS